MRVAQATQQAARWFARLHDGAEDEAVRADFERWLLADPSHAAEYRALCGVWTDFDSPEASRRLAEGLAAQKQRRRRLAAGLSTALLVAAVAVLAPRGWDSWQNLPQQQLAFSSGYGEVQVHSLPDGSQITLGADSAMRLTYTRRERRLELSRGEALFEIRHEDQGAKRGFVVDAGLARVSVLGTRFVVSRGAQSVDVTVTRGRTRVTSSTSAGELVLEAGQSAQVVAGSAPQRVQRDAETAVDFALGRIVFRHASLPEIAETLSRYRAVPVRALPTANGPQIDAVVQADGVESFLKALPRIAAVSVQQDARETRLLPR